MLPSSDLSTRPMRILVVFLDGVGIGLESPSTNPFVSATRGFFPQYLTPDGGVLRWSTTGETDRLAPDGFHAAVDACLETPGTPQSATGQASLFTGVNCSRVLGQHLTAFPNEPVAAIVRRENMLLKVEQAGQRAAFLNTYTPRFFSDGWPHSVSTLSALSLGRPLFQLQDDLQGRSLFHDITRRGLRTAYGEAYTELTPYAAGVRLARAATPWNLSLFEHFFTDMLGHRRDMAEARAHVHTLEAFLEGILEGSNLQETLVVVVSDHGNLEDLGQRGHTRNPVPVSAWGPGARWLTAQVRTLTDVAPCLLRLLQVAPSGGDAPSLRRP